MLESTITLDDIAQVVTKAVSGMAADIRELKTDVNILKVDVAELKTDVTILKSDVATLQVDTTSLKQQIHTLQVEHTSLRQWLEKLDGRVEAIENDITEIYHMLKYLTKQSARAVNTKDYLRLRNQMNVLLHWAERVSVKTGIPLPK